MSQQVNIALNFSANTQQARTALQDLQTNLTKIAYGTDIKVNPGQMQQASSAAKELAFHLNEAYNANTGNIDLTRLNTSLKSAGASVSTLSSQLLSAGQTGQQAFINLAQSISMAEAPVIRVNSLISRMWTTFGNTMRYQLAAGAISGFTRALSGALDYAQDLDKSLNNIRIVTGYSQQEMNKFAIEANKAAKALSTTTTAYTDASLIFYQQGLTGDAVKERADVVVQLANVTGQSAEVVSDQMTAIWNNFADGSKEMSYYADVITKLGAATASSTDEISDGLEKFAAVSETVGLSYEMATAALATVTAETRQSADVVGTAFKTIFSRMEGLKLGETLEDGTTLNKYSQALATAGVNIKDQNGQLREMDNILFDLGDRWQTLGKDQQVALAQSVAGVRQYNQFIALMSNWDKVQENLDIANNSTGELANQAEIYADSWEAAKDRVTASLEKIYSDVFQADFFKDLLNGVSSVIDAFGGFVDGVGGFGNILTGIVGILMTSFANKIPGALNSLKNNFLITFGQGAKIIEQMNAETQEMIYNELELGKSGQSYTLLQRTQLENAGRLSNVKAQYAMQEEKLSESEKRKYQFEIQGLQLQQQELEVQAEQIMQLKETLANIENIVDFEKSFVIATKEQEQAEIRANKERKKARQTYYEILQAAGDVASLGAKQGAVTKFDNDKTKLENLQKQSKDLKKSGQDTSAIDSEIEKLKISIEKRSEHIAKLREEVQAVQDAKARMQEANKSAAEVATLSERQIQVYDGLKNKIIELVQTTSQGGATQIKLGEIFEGEITQIEQVLNTANTDGFRQKVRELTLELETTLPEGVRSILELDGAFEKLNNTELQPEQKRQALRELIEKLQKSKLSTEQLEAVLKAMKVPDAEIKKITGSINQLSKKEQELIEKQKQLKASIENLNFSHTIKGTEALSAAIGGLSSMFFALQSLTSVVDTIKNPDLTGWEKFLSIGMGLTMALPMLDSALRGLGTTSLWLNGIMTSQIKVGEALQILTVKDITLEQQHQTLMALGLSKEKAYQAAKAIDAALTFAQSEAEEELTEEQKTGIIIDTLKNNGLLKGIGIKSLDAISVKLQTWAIKQKIKADAGETSGLWAKFAALVATNWIMLAIVAVLAVLIGLIALFVMGLKDIERQSPENKLKDLKTTIDDLKSSIQDTKDEIKNLTDTINNIESSYDAISKMTSGQQGFTEAVQETNEQVLELLDKYPILYKYLTRDIETGLLKIDKKGFDAVLAQQYSKLGSQQMALNYGRAREGKLTLDLYNQFWSQGGQYTARSGGSYANKLKEELGDYQKISQMTNEELASISHGLSTEIYYQMTGSSSLGGTGVDKLPEGWQDWLRGNAQTLYQAEAKQDVAAANEAIINDTIYKGTGSSLRAISDKEDIDKQSSNIHAAAQKAVDNFDNDWNDHQNYSGDSEQWDDIQKVIQSYGANASYVAQRQGEMVINVDGEEIKLTEEQFKNKLYQVESDALLNNAVEVSKSNVKTSLTSAGIDTKILEQMSQDEQSALDNVQFALEQTIGESEGQNLFKDMINDLPTGEEDIEQTTNKLNLMSESFGSIDWSQGSEAVDDYTQRLKELGITISTQNEKSLEDYAAKFRDNAKLQEGAASYAKDLNTSMKDQAAEVGLSEEAMESYVEQLKQNTEYQGLSNKQLQKGAIQQKKARTALDDLAESWKDIKQVIKENDVMSEDYEESITALKKAYAQLFDLDVSDEFLTSAESLELMEDALEGNQEAFDELNKLVAQDWLKNLDFSSVQIDEDTILNTDKLREKIQSIDTIMADAKWTPEVGISNESIEALNEYVKAGKVTVDELNGYFGQVHGVEFETEIQYMKPDEAMSASTATTNTAVTTNRVERVYDDERRAPESYTETITSSVASLGSAEVNENGEIGVPILKVSGDEESGGNNKSTEGKSQGKTSLVKKPNIDVSAGASNRKGNMGKSGSGSKKETKSKKKSSDEKERYHEIDKQIDKLTRGYDKLENAKAKASGKDLINLMQEEQKLMENDLKLQKDYAEEINNYLKQDKSAIEAYGANIENGLIVNYDELVEQQVAKYNAAVEKYNKSKQTDKDKEAFEKAEEDYEKFQKILEQYEETYELSLDQQQTIADKELEIWEKNNEILLEEMEQRVEAFEKATDALGRQIDYLEKKIEDLEDEEYSAAKAAQLLGNEMAVAFGKAAKAQEEYEKAKADWEQAEKDFKAGNRSKELLDQAWDNLVSAEEAVQDSTDTIKDIQEQIDGLLLNHLEDQAEAFDRVSQELEHYNGVLENYNNILDLLGRHYQDDDLMRKIADSQVQNAKAQIELAKNEYDLLVAELAAAKAAGANQETIDELTAQVQEAENTLLEAWQAGLEAVVAQFEQNLEIAIKNAEDALLKSDLFSLEQAQEAYDQKKSLNELYLEEYDKLYKINKLSRDINKSMSDLDSLGANMKLSKILDEINDKRASGVKMSQYEVDNLEKKYKLRLAEIALEEAQNAKGTMRLQRNASGNWSYVYTSDQEKIDQAQQQYEDALYDLENSSREYLDEMQEMILQNQQDMMARIRELRVSDFATVEEYWNAIEEIYNQHAQKNEFYYNQLGIALNDINTAYDRQIITFRDLAISEVTGITSIYEGISTFHTSATTLLDEAKEAFISYQGGIDSVTLASGADLRTLTEDISTYVDTTNEKTTALSDSLKTLQSDASTGFQGVLRAIQDIQTQYGTEADSIISKNDEIAQSFLEIYAKQAGVNNYLKGYDENVDYSAEMVKYINNGGQAYDAAFQDLIIQRNNKSQNPTYAKWKDNVGGLTQAEAMAAFAIADTSGDARTWMNAFGNGSVTKTQIQNIKAALKAYDTDYDYTEMMTSYLRGGGKASDDLYQAIWKNFEKKLNSEYANGVSYKDKYYKDQTLDEIWMQFAILGGGDSFMAKRPTAMATGGYTGDWGPSGKLAILHEKELVLNQGDTENFLSSLELMAHIVDIIDRNAMLAAAGRQIGGASAAAITEKIIQQTVSIEASFPGVTTAIEIEEALNNIVNDAAQYASVYKN